MPSEMFERGRRDADADALDENYYQYYYDYKQGYDQVIRNRRRTRRQQLFARIGRFLLVAVPVFLLLASLAFGGYQYLGPGRDAALANQPTPTRTPRPTLVPPTPRPTITPTPGLALRVDSFAVVSGTQGSPLVARQAPGRDQPKVTNFREGETVKLLEGPVDAGGLQWWRVEREGQSGWSAAQFLQPAPPPAQ